MYYIIFHDRIKDHIDSDNTLSVYYEPTKKKKKNINLQKTIFIYYVKYVFQFKEQSLNDFRLTYNH